MPSTRVRKCLLEWCRLVYGIEAPDAGPNWRATIARPEINYCGPVLYRQAGRQPPRGAAARLRFLCADAIGTDRIGSAEHARRRQLERGLLSGTSMATTVSINRAAYYWFHSRRRSMARSIASQFPMPAPRLASASSINPAETTRDALWAGQWSTESISWKRDLILLLLVDGARPCAPRVKDLRLLHDGDNNM